MHGSLRRTRCETEMAVRVLCSTVEAGYAWGEYRSIMRITSNKTLAETLYHLVFAALGIPREGDDPIGTNQREELAEPTAASRH